MAEEGNRFVRTTPIRRFKLLTETIFYIRCPLSGSNDRLTLGMCLARQKKGRCKDSKERQVKLCRYFNKEK